MTKLKKILSLLLVINFSFATAHADDAAAKAAGILILYGAAAGLEGLTVSALEQLELSEWKDNRANTTAQLASSCGLIMEARLLGNNHQNFLWVIAKNESQKARIFDPMTMRFIFSTGNQRMPDLNSMEEVYLEPRRTYSLVFPFPAKEDFANQKSLTIKFETKDLEDKSCESTIQMIRNPNIADTLRSTRTATIYDFDIGYGYSSISGNLANIADTGNSDFGLNVVMWGPEQGGFYLNFDSINKAVYNNALAARESLLVGGKVDRSFASLGYAHRYFLNEKQTLAWQIGIGPYALHFIPSDTAVSKDYSFTGLDLRLYWKQRFALVKKGIWRGLYTWGATLSNTYVPSGKLDGGTDVSGNATQFLLTIGVGN